jgi:hypothetical protein
MKAAARFIRIHSELLLFVSFVAFILGVLGPSLDRYDELHHPIRTATK